MPKYTFIEVPELPGKGHLPPYSLLCDSLHILACPDRPWCDIFRSELITAVR